MTSERPGLDPVTLALIQKRVDHIAERMGQVMVRSARSPIFTQSHDFSCFLTDATGRLVSQADGIPIHTGGGGMIVEALLSFLGAGTPPEVPSWGNMMAEGRVFFQIKPWIIFFPGLCLAFMVLTVNILGDGLRDTLDPRIARRMR